MGIRRRRACLACGQRFTTYERVESSTFLVVKKDGRREPFNRDKLLTGIRKACEKRPLPATAIDELVAHVESQLYRQGRPEISSRVIGELVMERLRELDDIAYIRFASVYRSFRDIESMREEVERVARGRQAAKAPPGQLPLFENGADAPS